MDDILTHLIKTEGMQVAVEFQSNVILQTKLSIYDNDDLARFVPHELITYLFYWKYTPQGHAYWDHIYKRQQRDFSDLRIKASKELILRPIGILNKPKKVTR